MSYKNPNYQKEYKEQNKEIELERARKWKIDNRDSNLEQKRSYRLRNREKILEKGRIYMSSRKEQVDTVFFDMYGSQCSCCGDAHIEFLTLEHIGGLMGRKRQSSISEKIIAIKEYRPDLYTVLCMNCNWSKRNGNKCPHEYE